MAAIPICASAQSHAQIMKVNASKVRLRDSAGTNSSIVATLKKGTTVLYWGSKVGQMYKVFTTSGKTGYVWQSYLEPSGVVKKNQIGLTTKNTPVYRLTGSHLKKMGTVPKGTMVVVVAKNSSWARCKSITGKTGYIPAGAVKRAF